MNQGLLISPTLKGERWLYTMRKGNPVVLSGSQHRSITVLMTNDSQKKLVSFGNFGINIADIVSFEKMDSGAVGVSTDKYKDITPEERKKNLDRMKEELIKRGLTRKR